MVTSKRVLEIIKKIIEKLYAQMTISLLGRDLFSKEQLKKLEEQGVDISNKTSLIELAYYHNMFNPHGKEGSPTSVEDMKAQQEGTKLPTDKHSKYQAEHLNDAVRAALEKLRTDYTARVEGFVRENNQNFKFSSVQGA